MVWFGVVRQHSMRLLVVSAVVVLAWLQVVCTCVHVWWCGVVCVCDSVCTCMCLFGPLSTVHQVTVSLPHE